MNDRSELFPDRVRKLKQRVRSWAKEFAGGIKRDAAKLDEDAVRHAYARWAPVYDMVFRAPLYWGRRAAVKRINALEGDVLEAGVGTGMSLPYYEQQLSVTGIDLSNEMLKRARLRAQKLPNIDALEAMDAGNLTFPDNHFDVTVAMYVITVVPDPIKVLRELERVTKPGGTVILVNHFSANNGLRARVEHLLERFSNRLGWNPEFPQSRILGRSNLILEDEETLPPFGLFTLLSFRKPQ